MAHEYYDSTGAPATSSPGTSATMRTEFDAIEAGFNKLPALAGNGDKAVFVNAGASGLTSVTAATARALLGLAIGSNVQAWDADLDAIAALVSAADRLPYSTGAQAWALTTFTAAGRALIDDASAAVQRTTLGATATGDAVFIAASAAAGRSALGAAASGANADITSITGITSLDTNSVTELSILTSGGKQVEIAHVASAVNYLSLRGSATGSGVDIFVLGSDALISMGYNVKGTGAHFFNTGGGIQFQVVDAASAVNRLQVIGAATTGRPQLRVAGTDAVIGFDLITKSTGNITFQSNLGGTLAPQFRIRGDITTAVNFWDVFGAATGGQPQIRSEGTDTNIDAILSSKGTGSTQLRTGSASRTGFSVIDVASSVNFIQCDPGATGSGATLRSAGTDTNVNVILVSKGTGEVLISAAGTGAIRFLTNVGTSGVDQFGITHTASAANRIQVTGAAAGGKPVLSLVGTDTNIGLSVIAKGAADIEFTTASAIAFSIGNVASSVNRLHVNPSNTGNELQISAIGTDTNVGIRLVPKGTGVLKQFGIASGLQIEGASILQNSQSAAYTLVAADANKHILHPSADTTARTFTIPANASVAYAVGTAVTFVNQNAAGVLTIAITTDTMRLSPGGTTGSRTLAANGIATALKVTATEWIISGTGLT